MGEAVRTTTRVQVRPWPHEPSIAHLVILDSAAIPERDEIENWVADIFDDATVRSVRTGALFPDAADVFMSCGFHEADRLTLLQRRLSRTGANPRIDVPQPADGSRRRVALRRMRRGDLAAAAVTDAAAFPDGWRNDGAALTAIQEATPRARARIATVNGAVAGFALTGRAGSTGYLQRLAVHPEHHRSGIARSLVDDAVRWLRRGGATLALVNTGTDNHAALELYQSCGFRRRSDELVVLDRSR